ncbi:RecT family recombinase [Thalassolituus sp.]|uniref:RecT family recombinase n=1 Tax=Thalassolituus sp. TaxID=2030822 RepID=UPI002620AC44|nr:RecT family recombinase [Thalassolituus sp.]
MNQVAEMPNRQAAIESQQELQNLLFNHQAMEQLYTLAQNMAEARVTVPKHLQGSVGDCMAICMQAAQWRMNPFAVAQKTHLVNGTLGYEAQLVNAVIQSSGAISGTFSYEYHGDGEELQCRVGATLAGENKITWNEWLPIWQITTKNSPLWKTNPKQQLGYLQVKNWARAFAPGAILGVYTEDELKDYAAGEKPVSQPAHERPAIEYCPDDVFTADLKKYRRHIESGARTHDEFINHMNTRFQLTKEQEDEIRAIKSNTEE